MLLLFLLHHSLASLSFPYDLTIAYVEIDKLNEHPMWFHRALSEYSEAFPTSSVSHFVLETSFADKYSKLLCHSWDVPLISPVLNYFYPKYQKCDAFLRHLFVKRRSLSLFYYLNDILKPDRPHRLNVLVDYPLYVKKFEHLSPFTSGVKHFFVYSILSQVLRLYEDFIKLAPTHVPSGYPLLLATISQSIHRHTAQILERRFPLCKPNNRELQLPLTNDLLHVLYPTTPSFDDKSRISIKKIIEYSNWEESLERNYSKYFMFYAISCHYSLRKVVPDYTSYIQASNNWIHELINDLIRQRSRHPKDSRVHEAYTKYMESLVICAMINNQFSIVEASILDKRI